jgi:membrane protein DedA with SNARE-associated domain
LIPDPSELVAQYGYIAIAIGSVFEGETFLLMGGFAAHRGLLDLKLVIAVAFVFSFCGDQFYFWMGRRHGHRLASRYPAIASKAPVVRHLLDRWGVKLILAIRFMIGLRTAGPIAMGWAGLEPWKFALFNLIGAALWAIIGGSLGYFFANALEVILQDLKKFEDFLLIAMLSCGGLIWIVLRWKKKKKAP